MQPCLSLTVSQLNQISRDCLEQAVGEVWVEGEVSGLARPKSGHCYFTLKDNQAQIRCAAFRPLKTTMLQQGKQVRLQARVSLFMPRGDYQLIVSQIETLGAGDLHQQYQQRWQQLQQQGYFDAQSKRPLPKAIDTVGIITSPSGAALHDVLSVLARRFSGFKVIIYPCLVQGEQAPKQLIHAIQRANQRKECQVLLLVRGGGSAEDLWAFNDVELVQSVANSALPIVSGVGHETDTTLVDFASDQRAATPSAAAELISPDRRHYQQRLQRLTQQLHYTMQRRLRDQQQQLDWLQRRYHHQHPIQSIGYQRQCLANMQQRLLAQCPKPAQYRQSLQQIHYHLIHAMDQRMQQATQQWQSYQHTLNALSPLAVLQRGYSHTSHQGQTIYSAKQLAVGDTVQLRFAQGQAQCQITQLEP